MLTCCQNCASRYILSFLKSQSIECIACTSASGAAGRLAAPVGCIRPSLTPGSYWPHQHRASNLYITRTQRHILCSKIIEPHSNRLLTRRSIVLSFASRVECFFSFTFLLLRCSAWNRKRRLKGEGFTSILLSVDNRLLGFRVETNLVAKFDQSDSRKSKLTGPWIEKNNWNEDDCEIQRKCMKNDRREYLASLICTSIEL